VTLTVSLSKATAAGIADLRAGLPVEDLEKAGWAVSGPERGPGGSTMLSATHRFSDLSQVPVLVADIAGSGPVSARPFRLTVIEQRRSSQDRYVASGTVDLRCGLACFDDPALASSSGYPLGLPPSEVASIFGAQPAKVLSFRFEVVLPGKPNVLPTMRVAPGVACPACLVVRGQGSRAAAHGAVRASVEYLTVVRGRKEVTFMWSPVFGKTTGVVVSSEVQRPGPAGHLLPEVGAGALVVLCTAVYLLWRRHRRWPQHGSGRRRRGRPARRGANPYRILK
jgi:hypothetical protein